MEEDEDGGEVAEVTWGSKETSARAPYAKHGGQHLWLWCSPKSLKMFIGAEFTMSVQFAGNRGTCHGTCGALVDICLSCAVLTTPLLLALNLNLRPTSGNGRKGVYRKICDSSAYTLMNQSNTQSPRPRLACLIPGPWLFQSNVYLFTKLLGASSREDPVLQGLPPASYNPSETVHPSALVLVNGAPQWKGGLSYFALIRYEDTPVGPYDELIAVSDGWANPYESSTSARITNIYLDSRKSVWNGRNNLSRYHFSSSGPI
jgi:hypothetical protein